MIMVKFIYSKDFFHTKTLEDEERQLIKEIEVNKDSMYTSFESFINGKIRNIEAVSKGTALETLQKNLMNNFLNNIPLPDEVNGYVKKANYRSYLLPHIRENYEEKYYLRLDIKDFFESITPTLVEKSLEEYILVNAKLDKQQVLDDIITICFLDERLPQGANTSPVLSNISFRRADLRIRKYCRKLNVTYTRYADDMLFSFKDDPGKSKKLIGLVNIVLRDFGLHLNYSKIINTKNLISLNGFVVGHEVSISRKKLSKLKRVLFISESINTSDGSEIISKLNKADGKPRLYFNGVEKLHNYLAGYRSFLLSWMPHDKGRWKTHCQKTIHRIETLLQRINS